MKLEYLMLGHTFKPEKYNIAGWFLSEKLDGMRAYWDGGISRGIKASEVPYANKIKDHRLKVEPVATGLWSRTGKVIHAPFWWLDDLPNLPLDGELWIGRNYFQELTSIVSRFDGSLEWGDVQYCVFDSPPFLRMFGDRKITVRDYEFWITNAMDWYYKQILQFEQSDFTIKSVGDKWTFEWVQNWLNRQELGPRVTLINQEQLPFSYFEAIETINQRLQELLEVGAEGVVLRKHSSFWQPMRCHTLLKYKPWNDAEAVVTGFTTGRLTEKGSRLLGMIGALIVDFDGKKLELSGLTDEEREFSKEWMSNYAVEFPGQVVPHRPYKFEGTHFKIGDTITFKYRELSNDGIPKEARYYRKRN